MDDLNQIQAELLKVYGSVNVRRCPYADVNSHVGDFAVIKWSEDGQYYRVKIHEEFVNETEVCFVDYGNVLKVPRREVLAPVSALSLFAKPAFGIYCQLSTAAASPEKWEPLLVDQSIHVEITDCKNDLYLVAIINNPLNKRHADVYNISAASNQTASQPETLEALFFGDLDEFMWTRPLKPEEQDFVEVIKQTIQNSANKRQEAKVARPTEAVNQVIEPVSEECLAPSAVYDQLDDHPDEETGADTDEGHVTTEHLPGEGRIEFNATLLSDVDEGTEMVYPAVDSAEREEHNLFDHSIGTDSGLTEAAGNEISEGFVSRRYSVAEKIAYMANLMRTRPKSPTSLATENAVSSRL
jgi:Tudor domain